MNGNVVNNQIKLHIDRGGMGGGEGNIRYKETFPESDWNDICSENGYYSTHFDSSRHGIFHYCIFSCNGWNTDYGFWRDEYHYGQGEWGDSFLIFEQDCRDSADWNPKYAEEPKIADTFMHELGHNIIGRQYKDGSHGHGYNPRANHLIDFFGGENYRSHCNDYYEEDWTDLGDWDGQVEGDCSLVTFNEYAPCSFCSNCWNAFDLTLSFNPYIYP